MQAGHRHPSRGVWWAAAAAAILWGAAGVGEGAGQDAEQDVEPGTRFQAAAAAYDAGEYGAAVSGFEALLHDGHVAPELLFNLGNAYYRIGRPGHAALAYRRAWHLAPRDPDIRANHDVILKRFGGLRPAQGALDALLTRAGPGEWAAAAALAYWLLFACWIVAMLAPEWRNLCRRLAWAPAAVLVLALAGSAYWNAGIVRDERVVVDPGGQALYAPLPEAQPHFDLPPGSAVHVERVLWPWLEISVDKKTGWVREESCVRVCNAPYL